MIGELRSASVSSKRGWLTRGAAIAGLVSLSMLTVNIATSSAGAAITAVTDVTVAVGTPSSAAGAVTTYVVGFTTSPTGALASADTITVALPSGTDLSKFAFSPVLVGATRVGRCETSSATAVTCSIDDGSSIPVDQAVTVRLNGVTNPTGVGSYSLSISTTADPTTVASPPYSITAPQSVGNLRVKINAPSAGAAARTTYTIKFTTSPTGALSKATPSTIRIALPAGTDVSSLSGSTVTAGGTCGTTAAEVVTCVMTDGSIGADRTATVTLNGVKNPPTAGPYALTVTTSSDTTAAVSADYMVAAGHPLGGLSVAITSPVAGTRTTYTITFTTSATGGLAAATVSSITITVPSGTHTSEFSDGTVVVGTTQVGFCTRSSPRILTCFLFNGMTIGKRQTVTVTLNGINNPGVHKAYSLTVNTTSDLPPVTSPPYVVTAAK